jgi:hypothetical protein
MGMGFQGGMTLWMLAACTGEDGDGSGVDGAPTDDGGLDTDEPGDEDSALDIDADSDGYTARDDCDDSDPNVHPAAVEVCDGTDNDCDALVDDADDDVQAATWYRDADDDGFGDPNVAVQACDPPMDHVEDDTDCDDEQLTAHPGAFEACDGIDNDCDATTSDARLGFVGADGTSYELVEYMLHYVVDDGSVTFCEAGEWVGGLLIYANVDVAVIGDVTIDGIEQVPCLGVFGDGITVTLADIDLEGCAPAFNDHGGGLVCAGDATVVASGLDFEGATPETSTAASVFDGCDLTLTDSVFPGEDHMGGGLYVENSTVTLERVDFTDIESLYGRGALEINDPDEDVPLEAASVSCVQCTFQDTESEIGGAVTVGPYASFTAQDSQFVGNETAVGAALLLGGYYDEDRVDLGSSTLDLTDVAFSGNRSDISFPSIVITETTFAPDDGGVSYNYEADTVSVTCNIDDGCDPK